MADKRVELLSPAGDMERLHMALTYGADAVYLSGTQFGMRAAASNFNLEDMARAVTLCKERGVRVYVACNMVMHGDDIRALPPFLESLQELGANAVIVSDMGALTLAKQYAPKLDRHISTQAGITNAVSAGALFDLGASRVILAREMTLREIREIRDNTPKELELEAFVHGSMCMAFSGRCLLSNYLAGRDANQGACAQPCRWKYHLIEERRPDEQLEISEDNGTFIFNSRDLCMIEHIQELLDAGISSLKIEGRMKSAYYAAVITNAYRHAVDAAVSKEPLSPVWLSEVNMVSHRAYSTGFYFDENGPGQYYKDAMYFSDCVVVAVVESCDEDGNAILTQRNKFFRGDMLELLMPDSEPVSFTADLIRDAQGAEIDATPHPMMEIKLKLPVKAPKLALVRKRKQT